MERTIEVLHKECGVPSDIISESISYTSNILSLETSEVCKVLLEKHATHTIKIISWNCLADIWYGDVPPEEPKRFKKVLAMLKKMIKTHDPDVVMLQEVTSRTYQIFERSLPTSYLSHVSYHNRHHWEDELKLPYQPNGTCIFIKKELGPVTFSSVSLGGGNVASSVRFELVPGYLIHIFNVHLNDNTVLYDTREREIRKIMETLQHSGTYIIGGDLNSWPNDPVHSILEKEDFETVCFKECDIDYIYIRGKNILATPMALPKPGTVVGDGNEIIKMIGSDHPPVGVMIFLHT